MIAAYEAGVNFFDNAEVYALGESERIMGQLTDDVMETIEGVLANRPEQPQF